jgi:hypothetical protein
MAVGPSTALRFVGVSLLVAAALVPGCQCDDELDLIRPALVVEPGEAVINGIPVAQDTKIVFQVPNRRSVNLDDIVAALKDGSDPAFTLVENTIDRVSPTEIGELVLNVRPVVPGTIEALLIVDAADPAIPNHAEVPITVNAVDVGLPDIEVAPTDVVFDVIGRADVGRETIRVENVGIRDLIIDEIVPPEDPAFRVVTGIPSNRPIPRGSAADIIISFRPGDTELHTSTIVIKSNDPDEPEVVVTLTAQAVECPTAVITRVDEGDIEPFDTVRLDGRDSFAGAPGTFIPPPPDGYSWQLVQRPVGSTAVLASTQNNTNELVVDLAGFYQVQLDVFAVDGDRPDDGLIRSCAPATIDIDVVPEDDLHIQLVWDHPDADFDLHLLRDNGRVFTHDGACYFSNRQPEQTAETPSWSINPDENPRLDVDDNRGYGPENINLKHPAPGSRWTVLVHYWNKQTAGAATATATVRLFAYGRQTIELSQTFEDDQQMWRAVEIVWADSPLLPPTLNQLGNVERFVRPF